MIYADLALQVIVFLSLKLSWSHIFVSSQLFDFSERLLILASAKAIYVKTSKENEQVHYLESNVLLSV